MSSPLTLKRRKLNESSNTLTKPFISPLKRNNATSTALQPNHNATNLPYQPSMLAHTISAATPTTIAPSVCSKPDSTPAKSTPIRKQPSFTTSSSKRKTDPAEIAAQRALTSLELQIRSIRNEIDTLNQARQITSSTTDAGLEDLAQKWKLTSQAVAEEVFGSVKERVCRMGGVAAWRESEKKKNDRFGGFEKEPEAEDNDADCEFDSQGEELPEEEQEWRKKEKARVRQEARDAMEDEGGEDGEQEHDTGKKKVWEEPGGDDDTFTMDMMLRSLNIELNVIGYDKVAQKWTM